MEIKPSTVLQYSMLTSRSFGIGTESVDSGENLIHMTIRDAKRMMIAAGIPTPSAADPDYQDACCKVTTALLFKRYAAEKARHAGSAGGRTGQSMTPLGSYKELMQAAKGFFDEARLIYPDADWPPFDTGRSAGTQKMRRRY